MAVEAPVRHEQEPQQKYPCIFWMPKEFAKTFSEDARRAGVNDMALAQSMRIGICEPFLEMSEAMEQAVFQDGYAELHPDSISRDSSMSYFDRLLPGRFRNKKAEELVRKQNELFEELDDNGVKIVFMNVPQTKLERRIAIFRRNHAKLAYLKIGTKERAFIGGVNFMELNFNSTDVMVEVTHPDGITAIKDFFYQINERRPRKDYVVNFGDTSLVVDAGKPFQSEIIRRAVERIDRATTYIRITTPIIIDGQVRRALRRAARRGVKVEFITDPVQEVSTGAEAIIHRFDEKKIQLNGDVRHLDIYFHNQRLHLKSIIVDDTYAIIGSNNFSAKGKAMWTMEAVLESTNPQFIGELIELFERIKKDSRLKKKYPSLNAEAFDTQIV